MHIHRQRVDRREISASTLINYIKPIKLFCEQLEISLPWKRIRRGLPRGRRYANDRVPTIEEIRKIIEYPDRRIKSIVYTMASSGNNIVPFKKFQFLQFALPLLKNTTCQSRDLDLQYGVYSRSLYITLFKPDKKPEPSF